MGRYKFFVFGRHTDNINPPKNSLNILLQFEQWIDVKKYEIRNKFDYCFDIFYDIHKSYHKNSVFMPLVYSKAFETRFKLREKHDFFFFGSKNTPHRKKMINKNKSIINFSRGCFSKKRDRYISDTKINLLFKLHDDYLYAPLHALLIQCKQKFLMVEKCKSYFPYIPNKHFIEFTNFNECNSWLKKEKERLDFAKSVYDDIRENYNYTMFLENSLKNINI